MARFYLGVDGGQSSTTALIGDDTGAVIGRGSSGPCNHVSGEGARERFSSAITGAVAEARRQAGLADDKVFAAACLGFSGGTADKESYTRHIIASERFKITHDAEIALVGGTGGEPGIVVIAGTGSMAFGRNADGRTARAGGWGYVFGDEGGAFDIARQALRRSLEWEEGWGRNTELLPLLLRKTGARSANDLMHRCYADFSRQQLASLAPLITAAAEQGDSVAIEIIEDAARQLARYVGGVYRNLFREGEAATVVHSGGVFQSLEVTHRFADEVARITGRPAARPKYGPAAGALLEALRIDGNGAELSGVPAAAK
jgi:N-acetylglucosamine kinase-like BadF-type ATPase